VDKVDLIYLDPPFMTQRDFGAFDDRWGPNSKEYLDYMTTRIRALFELLNPTGSIWLHCDNRTSHYLKVSMDSMVGTERFRNEVIWRYRRWPTKAHQLQRMHDVLLWYSKEPTGYTFRELFEPHAESTLKAFGTRKQQADFSSGHRKPSVIAEESPGVALCDVWTIPVIAPISKERTGYPTQKPEALLDRVIRCTSNKGDVFVDAMCGSGTGVVVANRLGRDAIGIDQSPDAIRVTKERLSNGK
jgi:site-specific DNA-methyltransferase (adenine-specific)